MNVMERVHEHFRESAQYFPASRIVGIFLQGSQNYGLEVEGSDVDTKLIVLPTFEEIAFNKKPHSTTHIRTNEEHIDFKDLRLYMQCFRKQNLNFVEILFTDYKIENPVYQEYWDQLVANREVIARYCPYSAVKTMKGIALEKFHAMEHKYPSKLEVLEKYGYDPKQLSHLVRVYDFIDRYTQGVKYEKCLRPEHLRDLILDIKRGLYDLPQAREMAQYYLNLIVKIADCYCDEVSPTFDPIVEKLLNEVQYRIMEKGTRLELNDN